MVQMSFIRIGYVLINVNRIKTVEHVVSGFWGKRHKVHIKYGPFSALDSWAFDEKKDALGLIDHIEQRIKETKKE